MNRIHEAQQFLNTTVFDPALDSSEVSEEIKNKIRNSKRWVAQFKKIGDLTLYLERFWNPNDPSGSPQTAQELEHYGLRTYESIEEEFRSRFTSAFDDFTTLDDFVIGETYTSWDLAIFARIYDNQQGIILIEGNAGLRAIFVKATMNEGVYPNEWIVQKETLKYFLKGIKNRKTGVTSFNENHKQNAAIIHSGDTPIYVFEKEGTQLELAGVFRYENVGTDNNGSKWFRLQRRGLFQQPNLFQAKELHEELEKKISQSRLDSTAARQSRLKNANPLPRVRNSITTVFDRSADVINEVLERACGNCEWCNEPAPFLRKSDQSPFLEVHHVKPLAQGGEDTVENARALCPNCHRKAHLGEYPNPFLKL